jgi:hypothetical protein
MLAEIKGLLGYYFEVVGLGRSLGLGRLFRILGGDCYGCIRGSWKRECFRLVWMSLGFRGSLREFVFAGACRCFYLMVIRIFFVII